MHNTISEETRKKLETACRQIAVAQELDDKIQRELYGHMEDKLLAYLNGEEALSEEDALILVQAHFGDPVVIREQLQEAYPAAAAVSVGRRLLAIFTITVGLVLLGTILLGVPLPFPDVRAILYFASLPGFPLVMYLVLRRWKDRMTRGEVLWFDRITAKTVWILGAILIGLWLSISFTAQQVTGNLKLPYAGFPFTVFAIVVTYGTTMVTGLIWLWWCDERPHSVNTLKTVTAVWIASIVLPMWFQMLLSPNPNFGNWSGRVISASILLVFFGGIGFVTFCGYRLMSRVKQRRHAAET